MHPFYGPSGRLLAEPESRGTGLVSMAAYLVFWAVAVGVGLRELNARFPKQAAARGRGDGAVDLLRERYARGEVDREQFLLMSRDLSGGALAGPDPVGRVTGGPDLTGSDLTGSDSAGSRSAGPVRARPDAVRRERSRV